MYRQNGLDILEFECEILSAKIKALLSDIDNVGYMYLSDASKDSFVALNRSSIMELESKLNNYSIRLHQLSAEHDPYSNCASDDALEFLYEEFLKKNIKTILHKIELYYENEIRNLLDNEVVHFSFVAKKVANYNLYHHGVRQIVSECFCNAASNEIRSMPYESLIPKALPLIERKYAYYSERIVCCPEIDAKLRALK